MGTIITRTSSDGTPRYTAQIFLKRKGKSSFREAKTFDRKQAASAWLEDREKALSKEGAIDAALMPDKPLREAIRRYIAESRKEIGRTKAQVLDTITKDPLADMSCKDIRSADLVAFANRRLAEKNEPQTVGNYISHLSAVFAVAKPMWDYPLDVEQMRSAQTVLKKMGGIAKSNSRSRRPTLDELDELLGHFTARSITRPSAAPMVPIILFALFSTRRQEEIVRITWADLDEAHNRVLVRDMKHPGQKAGNDTWCDLPEPAMRIIKTMPRLDERIFPYTTEAISAAFTRACPVIGIKDLRFHDLRHEGVSRLFEMGLNIPHVAAVSGHRSWTSLKRYTHMRATGDKYEGWGWLERVAAKSEKPAAG